MLNAILWGAGIVLAPLFLKFNGNMDTIRMSGDVFLIGSSAIYACLSPRKTYRPYLIALFVLIAFLNTHNIFYVRSFYQLVCVMAGVTLFVSLQNINDYKKIVLNSLAITCVIQSILMIAVYYNQNPQIYIMSLFHDNILYSSSKVNVAAGSLGHPNLSGALVAVTLPSLFNKKLAWFSILPAIALYLGESSMPVLTAIAGVCAFFYNKYAQNKYIPYFIALAVGSYFIISGFPHGYFDSQNRHWFWTYGISNIDNWILGNGVGHWAAEVYNVSHNGERFLQAHSEWIESLYTFGLLGIALIAYYFKDSLKKASNINYAMAFALFVNCYGNFFFHVGALSFIGISILALLYRKDKCQIGTVKI